MFQKCRKEATPRRLSTCYQSCPEFYCGDPSGGREQQSPARCPLTSTCRYTITHALTNNSVNEERKEVVGELAVQTLGSEFKLLAPYKSQIRGRSVKGTESEPSAREVRSAQGRQAPGDNGWPRETAGHHEQQK